MSAWTDLCIWPDAEEGLGTLHRKGVPHIGSIVSSRQRGTGGCRRCQRLPTERPCSACPDRIGLRPQFEVPPGSPRPSAEPRDREPSEPARPDIGGLWSRRSRCCASGRTVGAGGRSRNARYRWKDRPACRLVAPGYDARMLYDCDGLGSGPGHALLSDPDRGIRSDRLHDRSRGRLAEWSAARRDTDSRRRVFRTKFRGTVRFVDGADGPHRSIHSDLELDRASEFSAPDPSRHGNCRTPHLRTAQPARVRISVWTDIRGCTVRGKRESRRRDESGQSRV